MNTFEEMGLDPKILDAIKDLGFETPTPIQAKAIPYLLNSDKDLIALAQTGTGKTAAFSLPILQQIDLGSKKTQTLILSPTRELALQIAKDVKNYSKNLKNLRVTVVYGGANIVSQMKELERGSQFVVGTPGRMLDLLRRKKLKVNNITNLVLDEADEMLSMGFKDDLETILAETPASRRTLLFSATMPKEILSIANNYMREREEISSGKRNIAAENVNHVYYMVQARNRYDALKRIADVNPDIYGIVFCRTRRETKEVAEKLMNDGYNADALHGDLSQAQRDYVMNRFRTRNLQILVATDVAARGLDVKELSHIINYNLPDDKEVYIHRSGRTGRAGKKGTSAVIIHSRETNKLREIEKKAGKKFEQKQVPTGKEICEKQLFNLIDRVEKVQVNKEEIESFLEVIYKKLSWLSREELIQHFVSVEFNRFLSYYQNAPDLNINVGTQRKREDRRKATNFSRFFINLGSKNGLNPAQLITIINKQTQLHHADIGGIDIMKKFSFFEFDKKYERELLKAFKNVQVDGIDVIVDKSKKEPKAERFGARFGQKKRNKRQRGNKRF